MPDDLVTLTAYVNAYEAHIAKACLEEEGIYVFLQDVLTAELHWQMSNAIGNVKLQVLASDAERAAEILAKNNPPSERRFGSTSDDSEASVCLRCGKNLPDDMDVCPKCGWTFHVSDE